MKKLSFFVLMYFTLFNSSAQFLKISGKVLNKETQQELENASVQISTAKQAKLSNVFGEFSFSKIKAGKATITVKYLGFLNLVQTFNLQKDTLITIELTPFANNLEEIIVSSEKQTAIRELKISTNSLTKEQIMNVPSVGGEHDLTRILMLQPGVKSDNEGSAGIYVRGGSADQNLFLVNTAPLYKNSHLFGFLSPFNSDVIEKAELYKGGFPARFGGRLSSILDVKLKTANLNKYQISGSVGIISSKLTAEIPIIKDRVSLLLGGRRSYFDIFTAFFNGSGTTSGPFYKFYDFNGTLAIRLDKKNMLQIFTYKDRDELTGSFDGETEKQTYSQKWNSNIWGISLATSLTPKLTNYLDATISDYKMNLNVFRSQNGEEYTNAFETAINTFAAKNTTEISINENYNIKVGGSYTRYNFLPGKLRYEGKNLQFFESKLDSVQAIETTFFIENELKYDKWIANLGFRYSNYEVQNQKYSFPEPRFLVGYIFSEKSSLKVSFSKMNQPLHLLTNAGLGLPVDLWLSSTNNIKPQESNQISLSFNRAISTEKDKSLSLTFETYYKKMTNIIAYRDGFSSTNFTEFSQNNVREFDKVATTGQGKSYGLEVLLEKKYGKLKGWAGYTLSWTTNQFDELNQGKEFYARQDRRHDFSVVGMYQINKRWSINATWVFQTGQAITLPQAVYAIPAVNLVANQPAGFYTFGYINGERNAYRMKPTHRLDVSIQRKTTHKWGAGQLELSIYNVYNRQNPYYYYIDSGQRVISVSLFGIIPSLSYTFKIYTK